MENSPNGKILKSDVSIAKNYLDKKELEGLNDLVNLYLDIAENRAKRHIPMKMVDWIKSVEDIFKINFYDNLTHKGNISHEEAVEKAESEYEKYKIIQDIEDVTLDDVDEISSIKIDRRKPSNERLLEFITKVKNPYIFKINGKLVRISFADTDKTAEDCLTNVLKNLYK